MARYARHCEYLIPQAWLHTLHLEAETQYHHGASGGIVSLITVRPSLLPYTQCKRAKTNAGVQNCQGVAGYSLVNGLCYTGS
jgi:hypothetical protein